jgi:hypothetical protein
MKLFLLGAIMKAKIEMLLRILSFKLQVKFFIIALVGLLINIARFWIDVKKQPQKVNWIAWNILTILCSIILLFLTGYLLWACPASGILNQIFN